jgi:HlyD family secretion protein
MLRFTLRSQIENQTGCRRSPCSPPAMPASFLIGFAPIAFAAIAVGMGAMSQGCASKPAQTDPVVTVQAVSVHRGTIERIISTEGVLGALQQAVITPKITAPVRQFYVNRGDRVRKGQLLAILENRDLNAAATENRGVYEQAQASYESTVHASLPEEIEKARLDVKAARATLDAEQRLHESRQKLYSQGALARKDLDQSAVSLTQARNQFDIAERHLEALQRVGRHQELKSAQGQLTSAQGKYEGAEAQLAYSQIRSPIDGVVTDRPLYPGEMAAAGSPLFTVMDASQVVARAHVAQQDAALLRPGDAAALIVPGQQGGDLRARVTVVSPALDPNSTTVEVWFQARNPGRALKAGSTVKVSAVAQRISNTIVIPASAVLTGENGATTVMIVGADGKAHERQVRTGIRQGGQVQIADGLQEGEQVITVGAYGLPDNSKVHVESPGENSGKEPPKQDSGKG